MVSEDFVYVTAFLAGQKYIQDLDARFLPILSSRDGSSIYSVVAG